MPVAARRAAASAPRRWPASPGAAVLAGALLLPSSSDGPRRAGRRTDQGGDSDPRAKGRPSLPGSELQGVAPSFEVDQETTLPRRRTRADTELDVESAGGEPLADDESAAAEEGAATTRARNRFPPVRRDEIARRFSEAFVFYEVGKWPERAKTIFDETASPQLAAALDERPPRLPADAEVPQARVVNLVSGPRRGKAYTMSVSLLRVGLTSELRLKLNKKTGLDRDGREGMKQRLLDL